MMRFELLTSGLFVPAAEWQVVKLLHCAPILNIVSSFSPTCMVETSLQTTLYSNCGDVFWSIYRLLICQPVMLMNLRTFIKILYQICPWKLLPFPLNKSRTLALSIKQATTTLPPWTSHLRQQHQWFQWVPWNNSLHSSYITDDNSPVFPFFKALMQTDFMDAVTFEFPCYSLFPCEPRISGE